ncbi:TPA: hypothetical protein ACF7ZB_000386 [Kluyvera georgiana]
MTATTPLLFMEINSPDIWRWSFVEYTVGQALRYEFQGIVIHQQSLLARLAPPSRCCKGSELINLTLAQEHAIIYLRRVGDYCQKHHLQLWLQGEATPDSQELKAKFPEFFLSENNHDAFIQHFFQHTIPHILAALPTVRGLRLSLSTPDISNEHWKTSLKTLYQGIRQLGRLLILRDYQDKTWPRQMLRTALETLPDDVRASIKATELDYRPGFASNPNLLNIQSNRKWLELDLWGLEYGWTLLPCYLLEEIQQRLAWLNQHSGGAPEAITVRIDWEWMPDLTLNGSQNELNLFGLAPLIHEPEVNPRHIVHRWLQQQAPTAPQHTLNALGDIVIASHEWSCKTPTLLGRVLQCHSRPPTDLEHTLHLLHLDTRGANWTQSFQPLMPSDDRELGVQQCQLIELENQRSRFLADYLYSRSLKLLPDSGLAEPTRRAIADGAIRALKYTHIYSAFTQALSLKLWLRKYGEQADIRMQLASALRDFRQQNNELEAWFSQHGDAHPSAFATLLNPQRIATLIASLDND